MDRQLFGRLMKHPAAVLMLVFPAIIASLATGQRRLMAELLSFTDLPERARSKIVANDHFLETYIWVSFAVFIALYILAASVRSRKAALADRGHGDG